MTQLHPNWFFKKLVQPLPNYKYKADNALKTASYHFVYARLVWRNMISFMVNGTKCQCSIAQILVIIRIQILVITIISDKFGWKYYILIPKMCLNKFL